MNTIYAVNPKHYTYTPPPDVGRLPTNRRSGLKENLSFKSYYPENSTNKGVVDLITEKILITFFNYKDAQQLQELKERTKEIRRLEKQLNCEINNNNGLKLNEIF